MIHIVVKDRYNSGLLRLDSGTHFQKTNNSTSRRVMMEYERWILITLFIITLCESCLPKHGRIFVMSLWLLIK